MNDDDARDALARYAATTPDLDPRAGLAERIARRERARRATVAGLACFAALVAGTGVAVLGRDRGSTAIVATDDPTPAPSATESAAPTTDPVPDETPSPTPTPGDPTTRPSESPSPEPAPTETGTPPPWKGYGDGLVVHAALTPDEGRPPGTLATLVVRAEDTDGNPEVTAVEWGDGTSEGIVRAVPSCPYPPSPYPTARPAAPGESSDTFTHAWRNPGTYTITVRVSSGTYCDPLPSGWEQVERTVVVEVTSGEVRSNGPAEPDGSRLHLADFEGEPDDQPGDWLLAGTVDDRDGYVPAVTVDWGDGSAEETVDNEAECDDGDGRHYPRQGSIDVRAWHVFDPGTYTVTVTWHSAGCDGLAHQTGTRTFRITVPDY